MANVFFITHPDVSIDPDVPVPEWRLSARGRARMAAIAARPWLRDVRRVASSRERKAVDGAVIVGERLGLLPVAYAALGENDRSATGYLPKPEFEAMADKFFASRQTASTDGNVPWMLRGGSSRP